MHPVPAPPSTSPSLKGAFSKAWVPGFCELCTHHTVHLERHHIKYVPEITIDLCHQCHFTAHYFPNRLTDEQKLKLLDKKYAHTHSLSVLQIYGKNPVMLAKHFAPSRRAEIHKAQKEELERVQSTAL